MRHLSDTARRHQFIATHQHGTNPEADDLRAKEILVRGLDRLTPAEVVVAYASSNTRAASLLTDLSLRMTAALLEMPAVIGSHFNASFNIKAAAWKSPFRFTSTPCSIQKAPLAIAGVPVSVLPAISSSRYITSGFKPRR
jgi:hypothetical protein